jgi:hypothetical protein
MANNFDQITQEQLEKAIRNFNNPATVEAIEVNAGILANAYANRIVKILQENGAEGSSYQRQLRDTMKSYLSTKGIKSATTSAINEVMDEALRQIPKTLEDKLGKENPFLKFGQRLSVGVEKELHSVIEGVFGKGGGFFNDVFNVNIGQRFKNATTSWLTRDEETGKRGSFTGSFKTDKDIKKRELEDLERHLKEQKFSTTGSGRLLSTGRAATSGIGLTDSKPEDIELLNSIKTDGIYVEIVEDLKTKKKITKEKKEESKANTNGVDLPGLTKLMPLLSSIAMAAAPLLVLLGATKLAGWAQQGENARKITEGTGIKKDDGSGASEKATGFMGFMNKVTGTEERTKKKEIRAIQEKVGRGATWTKSEAKTIKDRLGIDVPIEGSEEYKPVGTKVPVNMETGTTEARATASSSQPIVTQAIKPTNTEKFKGKFKSFTGGVDDTIEAAAKKYGVSVEHMRAMANIESSGDVNARSSTGALGLYQFTRGTGKQYGMMSDAERLDPRKNAEAAARLTLDNKRALEKAGLSSDGANLYLAHQQGVGGTKALHKAIDSGADPSTIKLGKNMTLRQSMDLNGGKGMTPEQFKAMWQKKYDAKYAQINEGKLLGTKQDTMVAGTPIPAKDKPIQVAFADTGRGGGGGGISGSSTVTLDSIPMLPQDQGLAMINNGLV